jgi:putative ABC transport system permease protein
MEFGEVPVQTLWQDLRYGLRALGKSPGFTITAIATLALGIGLNTSMFSVLDAVLLRPLPFPNPELLVKVDTYDLKSGAFYGNSSYPDFADWRQAANPVLQHLSACEEKSFNLVGASEPQHLKGEVVSSDFFETLNVQPELGRSLGNFENQQSVVLSHSLWSHSFASNSQIVGQSIDLDGNSYQVVGVMPPRFESSDTCAAARYSVGTETQLWVSINPSRPDFREEMTKRGNLGFAVIGRLRPNASFAQAQAAMDTIASRLAQQYPDAGDLGVRLVPLHENMVGNIRPPLLILMGSVVLVLLIACANVSNLLLARSAARRTEIAIRASLGASRPRIIRQLVTESLLLALAGGSTGTLLAYSLTAAWVSFMPPDVPQVNPVHVNLLVLAFTFSISIFAGLIFGVAPAWELSRSDLNIQLKAGGRLTARRSRLVTLIVVSEIALSVVLLAAAGLLTKSLFLLNRVDPGFRSDHLLTVEVYRSISRDATPDALWRNWTGFYQQLLTRIEALPGVESAGATLALPMQGHSWEATFTIEGRTSRSSSDQPEGDVRIVSNNYFDVLKIPLKSGRYFSERDTRESPHVAVINEALARRYWPGEDPNGRFIEFPAFGAGRCQIVGVVADIRQANLSEEPAPGIYVPYTQEIMPWQTLVIRTKADPMSAVSAIRQEVFKIDLGQPIARVATFDQLLAVSTTQPRFRTTLLGGFAIVALLLSAIGIYGVMAYATSQRTHEIGLRIALGALPLQVLSLILRQGLIMVSAGLLAGIVGALVVTRLLASFLFNTTATDPLTFGAVALLLILVAAAACSIPARRAASTNPIVALRNE